MIFLRQLWGELIKMSARKRTYIGFGAFTALEGVFLWLFYTPQWQRFFNEVTRDNGLAFQEYFSMQTLGVMMVGFTVFLMGGIFISLVLGDIVAKETEEGSFRLLMSRPVSRLRLLLLKYMGGAIFTFWLVAFIFASSLVLGFLVRGWGGRLMVYDPGFLVPQAVTFSLFDWGEGWRRLCLAVPALSLSLFTLGSIAFCFSCFRMKPATAAILAIAFIISDMILNLLPWASAYHPYSLLGHMASYRRVFDTPIPWARLASEYAYLLGIDATCFILGWLGFQSRDFKS